MIVTKAKDLLRKQEVAIVVFTHGLHFYYDTNGNGETGNWVVDPEMVDEVDKVIVYLRDDQNGMNRIFIGNYAGIRHSPEKDRYIIRFSKLDEVGTDDNWFEFAEGSQNPINYVAGRDLSDHTR